MPMIPKHQMSEEDIKLHYITPAVTAKWNVDKITMETKLTDGKINLKVTLSHVRSQSLQIISSILLRTIRLQ